MNDGFELRRIQGAGRPAILVEVTQDSHRLTIIPGESDGEYVALPTLNTASMLPGKKEESLSCA